MWKAIFFFLGLRWQTTYDQTAYFCLTETVNSKTKNKQTNEKMLLSSAVTTAIVQSTLEYYVHFCLSLA